MGFAKSFLAILSFSVGMTLPVRAEEAVSIGGAFALLNKPARASAAVILIPGGDGFMGIQANGSFSRLERNQLVRTRRAYMAHGVASLTIDSGVSVSAAVDHMRKIAPRVVVVGTSRGTLRVPQGLSARPSGIVLTAGMLDSVRGSLGSPEALPPTLVIHHRRDGCRSTPPSAVEPFKSWGGARIRVVWLDGGVDVGDPCQANGHHGFAGLDGRVVATIAAFAKSAR
jgi:hypothetical protein